MVAECGKTSFKLHQAITFNKRPCTKKTIGNTMQVGPVLLRSGKRMKLAPGLLHFSLYMQKLLETNAPGASARSLHQRGHMAKLGTWASSFAHSNTIRLGDSQYIICLLDSLKSSKKTLAYPIDSFGLSLPSK